MFVLKYRTGTLTAAQGVTQAVNEKSSWIWGLPDPWVLLYPAAEILRRVLLECKIHREPVSELSVPQCGTEWFCVGQNRRLLFMPRVCTCVELGTSHLARALLSVSPWSHFLPGPPAYPCSGTEETFLVPLWGHRIWVVRAARRVVKSIRSKPWLCRWWSMGHLSVSKFSHLCSEDHDTTSLIG